MISFHVAGMMQMQQQQQRMMSPQPNQQFVGPRFPVQQVCHVTCVSFNTCLHFVHFYHQPWPKLTLQEHMIYML